MNRRRFYFVLALLGLLIPNSAIWPWLSLMGPITALRARSLQQRCQCVLWVDVVFSALV
jgi:hypothetical protein